MTIRRLTILAVASAAMAALAQAPPLDQRNGPHPPREAFAACDGKAAGAACSFTTAERTVSGTCFTPASTLPLACRPAEPPPGQAPRIR